MPSPETALLLKLLAEVRAIDGISFGQAPAPPPPPAAVAGPTTTLDRLLSLLRGPWFPTLAGYFVNHRPDSPYATLDDESKVQDLVYSLSVALVPDLHFEDPQQKNVGAIASTRVDFTSDDSAIFLEVKLATSSHTAKKVEAEISEDIVKYGKQPTFTDLVFFVYCHQYAFPNAPQFERGNSGTHSIAGHAFTTHCIVKP